MEPHAYGVAKAGNEILRCYQVGGASESGNAVDWKLMRVDEISALTILDRTFRGPRAGYKRGDKAMVQVYCQL